MLLRSRIAPTPSGYLHIGNALNFIITWLWVRKEGGKLSLRIDDSDTTRSKPEFIEDIFHSLDWLGINWDEGPQTVDEQERFYSQALRTKRYAEMINRLIDNGMAFACTCSRKDLLNGPCNCRNKNIPLNQSETALRIATPAEPIIVKDLKAGLITVPLNSEMKDFIIRRRDGIPAYQVTSLTDDTDQQINLIIRGSDLLSSTAAQLYLAQVAAVNSFQTTAFYHHPLINDEQGQKLSKSAGSLSLKTMREHGVTPEQFYKKISGILRQGEAYPSLHEMLHADIPLINFLK